MFTNKYDRGLYHLHLHLHKYLGFHGISPSHYTFVIIIGC